PVQVPHPRRWSSTASSSSADRSRAQYATSVSAESGAAQGARGARGSMASMASPDLYSFRGTDGTTASGLRSREAALHGLPSAEADGAEKAHLAATRPTLAVAIDEEVPISADGIDQARRVGEDIQKNGPVHPVVVDLLHDERSTAVASLVAKAPENPV